MCTFSLRSRDINLMENIYVYKRELIIFSKSILAVKWLAVRVLEWNTWQIVFAAARPKSELSVRPIRKPRLCLLDKKKK